jgi:N-acetylglutamate synthase-like GNAT family acetyltransferase
MGVVTFRPAVLADFIHFYGHRPQWRARALAAEINGNLVGLGGLALLPNDSWACFMMATDEFRRHPVALHRSGLRMIAEARKLGIRRMAAIAQPGVDAAERWLARFGFEPMQIGKDTVWVWKSKDV